MTNEKKEKRERTGINFNKETAQQIKVLAEQEKRSITAQAHILIEFAISQWNSKRAITPEWVRDRFESMGREKVKQLVFAGIQYLSATTPGDEGGVLAIDFLRKLASKTATDGDVIEVADAFDIDTATLSELIRLNKKGRKTSNGV